MSTLPSNETIREYVTAALAEIDLLNYGNRKWTMTIPVRESDSDVRISNAVHCILPLLESADALRAERDALAAEVVRLREALKWYADETNHEEKMTPDGYFWDKSNVWRDEGERARIALKTTE